MDSVSRETPPAPFAAAEVFLDELPTATAYAELLCGDGIDHGLIGPAERQRIWERHILNCAVVSDAAPNGALVADVGAGAGLPGLTWAIRRPDLRVTLVEPLLRRTRFLEGCVERLGLERRVRVVRLRAEEHRPATQYDVVTARAVAPLGKLLRWSAPLARPGGQVLALKGRSAEEEVRKASKPVGRVSDHGALIETYGSDVLSEPTRAVQMYIDRPQGLEST